MYIDPKSEKWNAAVSKYPCLSEYAEPVKKMNRELIGRDAQVRTLLATFERVELSNALLLASPGSGKALANDTPIPVDDERGYVNIGDMQVGDVAFDERGLPTKVVGVYPQGLCTAFEVTLAHGERIICNDEHLWEVRTLSSDGEWGDWRTMKLSEIMASGLLDHNGNSKWHVPVPKAVKRSEPVDVAIDIERFVRQGVVFLPVPDEALMLSVPDRTQLVSRLRAATLESLIVGESGIVCSAPDVAWTVAALATSCGMRADIDYQPNRVLVTCSYAGDCEAIVSVRRLEDSVGMTCIRVDSPNSLFICGSSHVVTHNTALVQGTMVRDDKRIYLEVNLSRMIADLENVDELGDRLKRLFAEASDFSSKSNKALVLFMDEFHQIVQLSPAAVEALKPLLADSATRGVRVIAATTNREFSEFVEGNQPLVERFSQIRLHEPNKETVVSILQDMAERYGVSDRIIGTSLYETIYDVTNRHMASEAQPRKSIMMLDAMVGWHRFARRKMNKALLADVMYEQRNINIAFSVDAASIRRELDEHVFAQKYATRAVEQRLQLSVAGLGDISKPQGSFLLTGSTGVGKGTAGQTRIPVFPTEENGFASYKLAKDIAVGDIVFGRRGQPEVVVGVYPQGMKDVYKVTLGDGRELIVDGSHLWGVYPNRRSRDEGLTVYSTETLIAKGLVSRQNNGREGMKYCIPMNEAVQWPEREYDCDPYVLGAFIGDGCLTAPALTLSSSDDFVVDKVASLLGAAGHDGSEYNYNHVFATGEMRGSQKIRFQTADVIPDCLVGAKSPDRFIPAEYMVGSIEQRWALVQGLFDTDGTICQSDGDRFNISYWTKSERLAYDIQDLLYSLGVASSVTEHHRDDSLMPDYRVHVKSKNADKWRFFTLPRHLETARKAAGVNKTREKTFDYVGIRSIEKLPEQDETYCLYVADDEHLYQAGQFVVTHNTELVKQLARILFPEGTNALIRMDMTEYANPDSLERFRTELTSSVSVQPYCIVLLDEIEKACAEVTRVLLSVLDDGRLTDRHGRSVSFLNAYIVLTTNAGSEVYKTIAQYESSDDGSGEFVARYDKLIRRSLIKTTGSSRFPPELLGRIDTIVPFQPLSEETMRKIVLHKLKELRIRLINSYGVDMHVGKRVVDYLILDSLTTDSDSGGARAVMSKLESEVTTNVASFINRYPEIRDISVDIKGELASENKRKVTSDAFVVVRGIQD